MAQISLADADALLGKLLTERVSLHAHFVSSSGAEARISGFVDSKNSDGTVVVSTSPPIVPDKGYLRFAAAGADTSILYGEKRELPNSLKHLADKLGESALVFQIVEFKESVALFFSI